MGNRAAAFRSSRLPLPILSEFSRPPPTGWATQARAMPIVTVVGAGLAGCEVAWQLAERGIEVRLVEQKPIARHPAQASDGLCEVVCSNSVRGGEVANSVVLLKEELLRGESLIMACA